MTKIELAQINTRLATENAELRKQVEDLKLQLNMHSTPSHRVAPHMTSWQAERARAMAAAREMAMRTGLNVKV